MGVLNMNESLNLYKNAVAFQDPRKRRFGLASEAEKSQLSTIERNRETCG